MKYDYLIVGAGYAGAVFARLSADKGYKVLVIDKRGHIGGNAYDSYNDDDILIHNYGPHIFHTNSKKVWDFLSLYTKWRYYQHWVLSSVDGSLVPIPINVKTINMLYGTKYTAENIGDFFKAKRKELGHEVETSEDVVLSQVGEELYEKFFKNYTKKQWGVYPSELDKSVISRIPIRHNFDCRYFTDKYQAMPLDGYTEMFKKMLEHDNIKIQLAVDLKDLDKGISYNRMVYTGKLDEYFDFKHGELPYRSLDFEFETFKKDKYQEAPVINYPNDYDFTRISEYKYLTGQESEFTTISREYSKSEGEAYYPVPNNETKKMVEKYNNEVIKEREVYFIGRLAEYKYYNMDNVILRTMEKFEEIEEKVEND